MMKAGDVMEYISDSYMILFLLMFASFAAGFVDSIAGGGGFILLPSLMLAGIPPHIAIGTNKLPAVCGTAAASLNFILNKKVIWSVAITGIIFSLLGSYIGSKINISLSHDVINKVIIFILPVAAILSFLPKKQLKTAQTLNNYDKFLLIPLITFILGIYDGFFGPGMGTFLILAFYSLLGLNMVNASAVAKVVNLSSGVSALYVYLLQGSVIFAIGIPLIFANILGNYIGSRLVIKNGQKIVRYMLIVVIVIMFFSLLKSII